MLYPYKRCLVNKNNLMLNKYTSLIIQLSILQAVGFIFSFFKKRLLRNIFLFKEEL